MVYSSFGLALNFLGTLLLIVKFVLMSSMNIISKNIISLEGYGLTTEIYDAESMVSLIHLRSVTSLSLVIIALGFLFQVIGANVEANKLIIALTMTIVILIFFVGPGCFRSTVISSWRDHLTKNQLFHEVIYGNLKEQYEKEVKSDEERVNYFINKGSILRTVAISLDLDLENSDLKTMEALTSLQNVILENLEWGFFKNSYYYLRKLKKLKGVYLYR